MFLQDLDFEANLLRYATSPKLESVSLRNQCGCNCWERLQWDRPYLDLFINNVKTPVALNTKIAIPLCLRGQTRRAVGNRLCHPTTALVIRSTNPKIYHQIPAIAEGEAPLHYLVTPPSSVVSHYITLPCEPPSHDPQQSPQHIQKKTPPQTTSLPSYLTPLIPSAPPKAQSLPSSDRPPQYAPQTSKSTSEPKIILSAGTQSVVFQSQDVQSDTYRSPPQTRRYVPAGELRFL